MTRLQSIIFLIFALCAHLFGQSTQTIAGGGPVNQPALQIGFCNPSGIAVDSSGNVYVSVFSSNQIWKIDSAGNVNLYAGNGTAAFSADGTLAVNAGLNGPQGLAFDTAGNLLVAESGANRILKISVAGIVTTVAGDGATNFAGDGGPAIAAELNYPVAVAVDSANNIYIADQGNNRVRMVAPDGTISTLAGNGNGAFSGDGGLAINASLNQPSGVAVDASGAVYIADTLNFRLRQVQGGNINTIAGSGVSGYSGDGGPATSARLSALTGVTVDQFRNIYIVEPYDVRLIFVNQSNIVTYAGTGAPGFSGDGGPAAAATFSASRS